MITNRNKEAQSEQGCVFPFINKTVLDFTRYGIYQCLQLKTFSNDFYVLESLENYAPAKPSVKACSLCEHASNTSLISIYF